MIIRASPRQRGEIFQTILMIITPPIPMTRSPNRKLREARDAVGDRLRAYAQKFKEGKRDVGGREARYSNTPPEHRQGPTVNWPIAFDFWINMCK